MPELPEVEVTRRGLQPHLTGRVIGAVALSEKALRHPYPEKFIERLRGCRIKGVERRAKYLLIHLDSGEVLLWHLGMSGRFHVVDAGTAAMLHQHVTITLDNGSEIRYVDPRRFGYVGLLAADDLAGHPWLVHLGPEPLSPDFDADVLYRACRQRSTPVKQLLMDAAVVVGVGNIYASEALYRAGIHPARAAHNLSYQRIALLVSVVKQVLHEAIDAGGSTIRDFAAVDGKPGYFAHTFQVYGRAGDACMACGRVIRRVVQAGRSTFYCPGCQR